MVEHTFTVNVETGIHLQPATAIVRKALGYKENSILFIKDDMEADAKSVTDILSLGASFQTKILIRVDGPEKELCLQDILDLLSEYQLLETS